MSIEQTAMAMWFTALVQTPQEPTNIITAWEREDPIIRASWRTAAKHFLRALGKIK